MVDHVILVGRVVVVGVVGVVGFSSGGSPVVYGFSTSGGPSVVFILSAGKRENHSEKYPRLITQIGGCFNIKY